MLALYSHKAVNPSSRIAVLALASALVVSMFCLRPAETQSPLRRISNTSGEGININPGLSGDGRIAGFESTEDLAGAAGPNHFRAIRANISVDPPTFFQMGRMRAVAPAISQDGSRIAFASKDDPLGTNADANSEIFLFNGANLLQLTNTTPNSSANRVTEGNFQPSISDDGRYVAFSSNRNLAAQNGDGNLEIFIYDSVAATFTQLTNSTGIVGFSDAKISGDGSMVACVRDVGVTESLNRDLIRINRNKGLLTFLAINLARLAITYGRAISDDGTRVVYSAWTAENSSQVFFYDGRTGNVNRQVTTLGARVTEVPLHPTISGDGRRIAFATRRAVTGFSNSDASVELYTYDIPTGAFARVTSAPAEADCFDGSSAACEVVTSLNDDGATVVFNFPRVLSGPVASGLENKSEIYAAGLVARSPFGTLTSILNQASLGHEPSPVKAVAPNSIAAAFGSALAHTTQQPQKQLDGTFPTNVGGTTVTVNGRAAQIFFVSPDRVHFLTPPQTEIGMAEVVVTNADGFASKGSVPILLAAPGIFTKTGDGIGDGMIVNADTLAEGPFDPTGGNLRLLILTTGVRNSAQTIVNIGGRTATAQSVTTSPGMPGLDEVRVVVPADLRGAGTFKLFIQTDGRESNPVTVTFTGDPSRNVVINEVLVDPPDGIAGDANHDGVRDGTDDEFIELVNGTTNELISLGGWTIRTRATGNSTENTRFTFPSGTFLPAGEAIVIFGGGNFNPADTVFGCAQVLRATTATGLSLTNSGLTILVRNAAGTQIALFSYGGSTGVEGENNQSLTRSPDITGAFVQHTGAIGSNGRRFSPGLRTDGAPFGNCPSILTSVTLAPLSATITVGQTQQFTAQAFDQYGRVVPTVTIHFSSDNTNVATIDSATMNSDTGIATAVVNSRNPGMAQIVATATDGTSTINSNQAPLTVNGPSLSINDASQNEGSEGPTTFTFTVSLSTPAPAPVTFDITTQDDTATAANNDYVVRSLVSQTIAAGQQTYTFDVTVNGDSAMEPTETFFVNVTIVTGASVSDTRGVGVIVTDDLPLLSVNDVSQEEGNNGTTTFTLTVSSNLPAPPEGITFNIATQDNSATVANSDYVARSLTSQSIPAGQTSYTFDVTVNGDTTVEPSEAFFVNISNVSLNAAVADGQGVGTIQNDDAAQIVISQIYGGGGNSGATFKNDFIEIFNRGTTTVDLAGWSVQYASATGSSWSVTPLCPTRSCLILPGRYFLVQEDQGSGGTTDLPTPDAVGTTTMTTGSGKVALVSNASTLSGDCPTGASILDFIGYGSTASCFEGTGPAAAPGNTTADLRKAGGCLDTNDNAADFLTASPNPRNSSSPVNDCTAADLEVTKTDSPDPVIVGSNVTYTITVTNHGPASAQAVVVTDNLPANVTFVSCNSTGPGVCSGSGNNRTVTFGSIASGASETITIIATANGPAGTPISNTATVGSSPTDPNSTNNSATATTDVNNPTFADLSISKTDSPDPVFPTQTLTYTLTVINNGPDAAQTVVVTDNLPAEVTFVDCTSNQGGVCGRTAPIPTVTFTSLASGITATITINVTVKGSVTSGTVITNNASVSSATGDSNGGNNAISATTTVQEVSAGQLVISEFRTRGPQGASDEFVEIYNPTTASVVIGGLKIRASNGSGTISDRVIVTAATTLGPGCHYLIANSSASGYSGATPANQTYTTGLTDDGSIAITRANGTTVIDQVGMSAGSAYGEGTRLTALSSNVEQSYERKPGGSFGNGTDTNDNSADFLLNASSSNPQNSSSGCIDVTATNLSITKSDSPDPVGAGSNIAYTIAVTNNGPAMATNLTLSDTLPANTTFASLAAPGGWTCTTPAVGSTGSIGCTATSLGLQVANFTLTVNVDAGVAGSTVISNTASISSSTPDANGDNNSAAATTTVQPSADLSITKRNSADPVPSGSELTYTLQVSNDSTDSASGVTVTDNLPAEVTFVSCSSDGGGVCGGTGNNRTVTFTSIAGGATVTIAMVVRPNHTAAGTTISNTASVASSGTSDPHGFNNSATQTTAVVLPSLAISYIYGGGGASTGSPSYTRDFVEIFNRGSVAINLLGLSLQQGSSTGNISSTYSLCPGGVATCTVNPGRYHLIETGTTGLAGTPLSTVVTPDDAGGTLTFAATNGKGALVTGTTALGCGATATPCGASALARIVDLVGYGTGTTQAEGNSPTGNLSTTTAARRKASGCTDTNVNSADFDIVTPTGGNAPRNSASAANTCP